jgi:uncharacterized membrane protein
VTALLTFAASLGAGIIGGVFFAFSSFVMPALARLPPSQGVAAMQSINVTVLNRLFLDVFVGTAVLCLVLCARSVMAWAEPGARFGLIASLLYLVGVIAVTRAFHIPRNDALGTVAAESAEAAELWSRYLVEWCFWNHVRGAAAVLSAGSFALALKFLLPTE